MYRLGLLACDFVPDDLRDRFDDYPVMFARAIASAGVDVSWRVFRTYEGELPESVDSCDGYITTGSRDSAYDDLRWISLLEDFVRSLLGKPQPLVGICFGHQVIARALGGTVEKSSGGWGIGVRDYETSEPVPWMEPPLKQFSVPVCHQDQVMRLPETATLLASSEHCENFMIQFNDTMIGIQGHPEFDRDYIAVLLEKRREIITGKTREVALASLARPGDNTSIMRWIANFLRIS